MIARVFPRKTNATPVDDYAFVGDPPLDMFIPEDITEVHVSVVFTWDLDEGERLARAWGRKLRVPVKIGGPATGERGGEFVPGMYLKPGYVITSRGCPNQCWFCEVPKREGNIRELPIMPGCNVLDDNLLACSDEHIYDVFTMLRKQRVVKFTGGFEAARFTQWHVDLLMELRPKEVFFAFDTGDDLLPLETAAELLIENKYFSHNTMRCYVLVGYPGDTILDAEVRLLGVKDMGFGPMAMLYRDESGKTTEEWRRFQGAWARPAAIYGNRDDRHLPATQEKEVVEA